MIQDDVLVSSLTVGQLRALLREARPPTRGRNLAARNEALARAKADRINAAKDAIVASLSYGHALSLRDLLHEHSKAFGRRAVETAAHELRDSHQVRLDTRGSYCQLDGLPVRPMPSPLKPGDAA